MGAENKSEQKHVYGKSRMPESSVLFEKVIPAALVSMGILTIILILFAAGVLLGFVKF